MSMLRKAAEAAEEATGLRAEIIRGVLMMSPTPRLKHAHIINAIYDQLRPALPEGYEPLQVASLSLPHDPEDYATPDLMVCDVATADSDDWLAEPGSVEFVLEVVSRGNSTKDTRDMVGWYAEAEVPAYLVVDPRDGTWTLHTEPRDGVYQGRLHKRYGDDVVLDGLKVRLRTDGLPLYGDAGAAG
ncbi:Uma2 family endonuclease [Streptomyces sp. JJ36]|uniref:Uma2 family endonuclease n=1 Tax=Streptomyces sp. JJ36 TaxID=2736645 RepID=UPI001F417044|nr:Uma2 family endonuclease [Streptomyces sp. JJ36]